MYQCTQSVGSTPDRSAGVTPIPTLDDLKGLSTAELINTVQEFENEMRHYIQENEMFEKFIDRQEPSMIACMEAILKKAGNIHKLHQSRSSLASGLSSGSSESVSRSRRPSELSGFKGPRINLTQKTDLVLREIEEAQHFHAKFLKKSKHTKFNLRAEMEELEFRAREVDQACRSLEQMVAEGDSSNRLNQKIPAERFVRYMQDWSKNAQQILEKMRLRTISYKSQLSKLKAQQERKHDLGESVDVADLEKSQIQRAHLLQEIKQKNENLIKLKRMSSRANMLLTMNKKILDKQKQTIENLRGAVEATGTSLQQLKKEAEITQQEVKHEQTRYIELKKLVDAYRMPSTFDYIKTKAELRDLLKETHQWQRKEHMLEIGLVTYTRMMCQMKGTKKPNDSWYTLKEYELSDLIANRSPTDSEDTFSCISVVSDFNKAFK